MSDSNQNKTVGIVGGGLVGSLQACFLARRGYHVDLYEMRSDIRSQEFVHGRSINLALSCRGREALRYVGLEDEVVRNGIPMYGRMVHDVSGKRRRIFYGRKDQYIMSVDRRRLNELLLTAAEKHPNVTIHFSHKLVSCKFDDRQLIFKTSSGETVTKKVDLIIGCDGAFSAVRGHMMKSMRLDFSQEYIPHGYIELRIPSTADDKFAMETNYLHIWPRHAFMLIALPNVKDNSFVLTLFMPFAIFETLTTDTAIIEFFQDKFPDALQLIGRESLLETFSQVTPSPAVSIKCNPYHKDDCALILGDAAHAMVPFYGQGLNCGFEDLLVFEDMMNAHNDDFAEVLPAYTQQRYMDAHNINDLAMYNYVEMRSHVNSRMFLLRKAFDNCLHRLLPRYWVPLYTMVSFTRTRYHECVQRRQWQDKVIRRIGQMTTAIAVIGLSYAFIARYRNGNHVITWSHFNNMASKMAAMMGRSHSTT